MECDGSREQSTSGACRRQRWNALGLDTDSLDEECWRRWTGATLNGSSSRINKDRGCALQEIGIGRRKWPSGSGSNKAGQRRNGLIALADAEPVAEIMPERKPQLFAGLQQTEHRVAGHATIAAHGAAGDLSFGDEAAQIVFRGIGVKGNIRSYQHFEQLALAPLQTHQEFVELAIAGADPKVPLEPTVERIDQTRGRTLFPRVEGPVQTPDKIANSFDGCCGVGGISFCSGRPA